MTPLARMSPFHCCFHVALSHLKLMFDPFQTFVLLRLPSFHLSPPPCYPPSLFTFFLSWPSNLDLCDVRNILYVNFLWPCKLFTLRSFLLRLFYLLKMLFSFSDLQTRHLLCFKCICWQFLMKPLRFWPPFSSLSPPFTTYLLLSIFSSPCHAAFLHIALSPSVFCRCTLYISWPLQSDPSIFCLSRLPTSAPLFLHYLS